MIPSHQMHVVHGSSIARYVESFGGTDSDGVVTESGKLESLDSLSAVLGFTHHWNDRFDSMLSGAFAGLDNHPSQAGSSIESAVSAHANLVYSPLPYLLFGGELMWGQRENFDGADGDALRL